MDFSFLCNPREPTPFAIGEKIACIDETVYPKKGRVLRSFSDFRNRPYVPRRGEVYVVRGWNESPLVFASKWSPPHTFVRAHVLLVGVFGVAMGDGTEVGFIPEIFAALRTVRANNQLRVAARRGLRL